MSLIQPLIGIALILLIAYAVSENRQCVLPVGIMKGITLQFGLALLLLKTPEVQNIFLRYNYW